MSPFSAGLKLRVAVFEKKKKTQTNIALKVKCGLASSSNFTSKTVDYNMVLKVVLGLPSVAVLNKHIHYQNRG